MANGPSYLPTSGSLLPRSLPVDPNIYNDENLKAELAKRSAMGLEYQPGPPPPAPIMPDADILRKAAALKALNDSGHALAASRPATMMSVKQGRDVNLDNPYAKQALASQDAATDLPAQLEQQRVRNVGQYNSLLADYNSRAAQVRNANISGGEQFLRDRATLSGAQQIQDAKTGGQIKVVGARTEGQKEVEDVKHENRLNEEDNKQGGRVGLETVKQSGRTELESTRQTGRRELAGDQHGYRTDEIAQRGDIQDRNSKNKDARKQMTIGTKDKIDLGTLEAFNETKTANGALHRLRDMISGDPDVLDTMNALRYDPANQHFSVTGPFQHPKAGDFFKDLNTAHHYLIQGDRRRSTNQAGSMLGQTLPRWGNDPEAAIHGIDSLLEYSEGLNKAIAGANPRYDFEKGEYKQQYQDFTKGVENSAQAPNLGTSPAVPKKRTAKETPGADDYDTRKYMARTPKGLRVPPESIPELIKFARSGDKATATAAKATLDALTIKE